MILSRSLGDTIARAIRAKDTSYFFENYSRQADAVLDAIDQAGYVVVKKDPSGPMIEAGVDSMTLGIHNKGELVAEIWRRMLAADLRRRR